jgi:hypothetical protein
MGGNMKKGLAIPFSVTIGIFFCLVSLHVHGDVASCQTHDQGTIISCMEFASSKSIPASMEKECTSRGLGNNKWVKSSCPRIGSIGYCAIFRNDTISQVVYCYKRQSIPDKLNLGFCKQACKGSFTAF